MNRSVKANKPIFQTDFILLPRHAIDSGRSLTLKRIKAVTEQIDIQMVEQGSEPFLPSFPCCFSHTVQPWDMHFPLCVRCMLGCAVFSSIGALPSPTSARASAPLFGWFTGTTAPCDFSTTYTPALWFMAFADRPSSTSEGVMEISRFSCMLFSQRARALPTTQDRTATRV